MLSTSVAAPCRGECGNEGCLDDGTCCHTECLGGCTLAGSTRHCYSCKHIRYGGECLKSCPAKDADGNELYEVSSLARHSKSLGIMDVL